MSSLRNVFQKADSLKRVHISTFSVPFSIRTIASGNAMRLLTQSSCVNRSVICDLEIWLEFEEITDAELKINVEKTTWNHSNVVSRNSYRFAEKKEN